MLRLQPPRYAYHHHSSRILLSGLLGHAGAMLQARRLGKELVVGIHSDQEIMDNKGPTVMTLKERLVYKLFEA